MQNIRFTVSKNVVTLPEVEGVDSFLIEASVLHDIVGEYGIGNFRASEYTPGTKVTLDADSIKQITVYAIIDGEKVFLRRASVRSPWTGIFDENYVSSRMFLEQANENTFPKAVIEDEQEVVEEVETKSQKAHALVDELGFGSVWEKYEKTRVYFDSQEIVKNMRTEIEFFNGHVQKGELDGNDYSQPDMRRIVGLFETAFYDFDKDELVLETVWHGFSLEEITNALKADFQKAVDAILNPEDAEEALSTDEINETIAGIEIDEQEEEEISVDSSKWDEYNAEGRIAILNELHPHIKITLSEYENDVSLGRGSIISARKVYVNRSYIEISSFIEFYDEFKSVISMKPRKRNTAAFSRKKNEEVDPMREELYARAKKKSQEKDRKIEALAMAEEYKNADEIEEHLEEGRRFQHEYDVFKGVIRPDPLDEILDDVNSTLNEIEEYGNAFMNWINSEQEDAPF